MLLVAVAVVVAAAVSLAWLVRGADQPAPLVVYCAAALRPAVEPILASYEAETGQATVLQLGPSGALEAQLRLSGRGDLYLPAASEPFLTRLEADGLVEQPTPVARLRLVLAFADGVDERPRSVEQLLASGLDYGVCNVQAAAGEQTRRALEPTGLWPRVELAATAMAPTVTQLADALRDGGRLEAGFVWNATAGQYGLAWVELPELADARSVVGVGVLMTSRDPQGARRLARYLATSDAARSGFARFSFDPVDAE